MEKEKRRYVTSMLFKKDLERGCGLTKSMDSPVPIGNTGEIEDSNRDDEMEDWWGDEMEDEMEGSDDQMEDSASIRTHLQDSDLTLEESSNDREDSSNDRDREVSITILNILREAYREDSSNDREDSSNEREESSNDREESSNDREESSNEREESSNERDGQDSDLTLEESSNDREDSSNEREESSNDSDNATEARPDFSHLWVQCDNCYGLNYKKYFYTKMYICEHCGWHLKMNSSDRIDLSIDPDTWNPMDEDMVSIDPIEWNSTNPEDEPLPFHFHFNPEDEPLPFHFNPEDEPFNPEDEPYNPEGDEPYEDRLAAYQTKTGLPEAVQTGIGELNGIPVAVGVMDFEFIGGSMASVVGEKITRLIEYATNHALPLIIVCASGGARMQEGSVSLMQMAKISSTLYDSQSNKKLFYISILASPTTGGVTASFGMLGDIIIAEPNAYIAFAGKRVIEELLKIEVPEGVQETEYLFDKGSFDLIVPRNLLKSVLTELFKLHGFLPVKGLPLKVKGFLPY
uniref:Acetyl-coenzyme A carboxylase carboxyl transferase subunit beta, chloroplastic n=1 Tax=Pentasachme caudatum TaxID=1868792 RepID=A0A7T0P8U4_9GENT|nr:acetyl-CoA carboxylase carboxyltransferase beta subunit [Pentasachme caudatum]QPK76699.1 acetyl-CoA carboxylase carboxyltransferase beta subunit [Pentasachme caudatum]